MTMICSSRWVEKTLLNVAIDRLPRTQPCRLQIGERQAAAAEHRKLTGLSALYRSTPRAGRTHAQLRACFLSPREQSGTSASARLAMPLGRMGDPTETGAVAAFLASSDSSFMTGGEVFVDGGLAKV